MVLELSGGRQITPHFFLRILDTVNQAADHVSNVMKELLEKLRLSQAGSMEGDRPLPSVQKW
ncbi:hypothetical protein [Deinococcus sp. QL22]|uniref:hypothetical protein n=1 Tax=Deinococcus sp. QL22 TaxID=2939437 RepID=UPI002016DAB0|nr:hypothetical protein [Deinococcus sp. QL22]UQN06491.1 hypothetical protein M1R55_00810 [Deinococcus sp. QL22]